MHKSRLAALVIDSKVGDVNEAAEFWSKALGYPCIESKENWALKYVHLKTHNDEPHVLVQKVEHESRVHLDIETDNVEAEVARAGKTGCQGSGSVRTLDGNGGTHRASVLCGEPSAEGFCQCR